MVSHCLSNRNCRESATEFELTLDGRESAALSRPLEHCGVMTKHLFLCFSEFCNDFRTELILSYWVEQDTK